MPYVRYAKYRTTHTKWGGGIERHEEDLSHYIGKHPDVVQRELKTLGYELASVNYCSGDAPTIIFSHPFNSLQHIYLSVYPGEMKKFKKVQ